MEMLVGSDSSWGGSAVGTRTGAVQDGQLWADPVCGHLSAPRWPQPRATGRVETQVSARARCRLWLAAAHSVLTVTLGLQREFHINSMRSRHDMSHDNKLGQSFTYFGQGGWATST